MSKKIEFLKYVEKAIEAYSTPMNEEAQAYWDGLRGGDDIDKPAFTDNGKIIMKWFQDNQDQTMVKAKDVAESLFISSRAVSGACRKLVSDGYIEKIGQDPVLYAITEKGKNVEIN